VLLIHGQQSLDAASPFLPNFDHIQVHYEKYHGECSKSEIERMAQIAIDQRCEVIIGLGGGKIMDLAKAAAAKNHMRVVLLPTLASTCAAWTPLSVIYTDNGDYLEYNTF